MEITWPLNSALMNLILQDHEINASKISSTRRLVSSFISFYSNIENSTIGLVLPLLCWYPRFLILNPVVTYVNLLAYIHR